MAEITALTPDEEAQFQQWIRANNIKDLDHPDSRYDYRGYWKATGGAPRQPGLMLSNGRTGPIGHLPDTFKQHGHESFSQESQYSRGPFDGGMWVEDTLVQPPPMTASHTTPEQELQQALLARHLRGSRQ
jgi:hypothetical protein